MRKSVFIWMALTSFGFSSPAWALGLGEITVESFLNQPLQARINLLTQPSDELDSVSVDLAPAEDYELIGVSRDALSVPIEFRLTTQGGNAIIRATSQLPVRDPVVRMLVEVNWANGRLLREYTLFLDPPTIPSTPPPPPEISEAQPETVVETTPAPAPELPDAEPASPADPSEETDIAETTDEAAPLQPPEEVTPPATLDSGVEYGPVQGGETLWGISRDWGQGSGYTVNQVMMAIQRNNPQAFNRGNINSLKRGAILRMPDGADIAALTNAQATAEVLAQEEEFELRRLGLTTAAPTVADAAPVPELMPPPPVPELSVSSGRLELIPPAEADEMGTGDDEAVEPGDEVADIDTVEALSRSEEELANIEQENEYLQERVAALEAELEAEREQAAARVEDNTLADMEQRLRDERLAEQASQAGNQASPWYSNWVVWLIGFIVLLAIGLFVNRRRGDAHAQVVPLPEVDGEEEAEETVQAISEDAEEILRVLAVEEEAESDESGETGDDSSSQAEAPDQEPPQPPVEEPAEHPGEHAPQSDDTVVEIQRGDPAVTGLQATPEDDGLVTEELEADDPEVKLDLARAYIAMGDKEAARSMLDDVLAQGSDEQQTEANAMLKEL